MRPFLLTGPSASAQGSGEVPGRCMANDSPVRTRFLVVLLLVIALPAAPAVASEDASDPPTVSGPLFGPEPSCHEDEFRGMRTQECSWWLDLAPAETNLTEDYRAEWVQLEMTPPPGSCATNMVFGLGLPDSARLVSAAPAQSARVRRAASAVTRLDVDAEGAALVPGTVENEFVSAPGKVRVAADDGAYVYEWTGRWPDKVVVALGLQMAGERIPPEVASTWFGVQGFEFGPCGSPRSGR